MGDKDVVDAKYMVFLKNSIDAQLRELLSGYIAKEGSLEFMFCSEWEQNGSFVFLRAENFKNKTDWGINIPVSAILSVADFSKERPVGFTKSSG